MKSRKLLFEDLEPCTHSIETATLPFNCGDEDLNEFYSADSLLYQDEYLAKTYTYTYNGRPVAFFCVSNDKITQNQSAKNVWRKIKKEFPHKKHRSDYPAVKIGRLGVDLDFIGNGIGKDIITYVKAWFTHPKNKTGCRFITVDAYQNAIGFYEKCGFSMLLPLEPKEEKTDTTILMYYDLKQFSL